MTTVSRRRSSLKTTTKLCWWWFIMLLLWEMMMVGVTESFCLDRVSVEAFAEWRSKNREHALLAPIVVEDVVDPTLCEELVMAVLATEKDVQIELQTYPASKTFDMSIQQALVWIHEQSNHARGVLVRSPKGIVDPIYPLVDPLFANTDCFQYLDKADDNIPGDHFVLGADGSSSLLASVPYTKLSLALDGFHMWRFMAPGTNFPGLQKVSDEILGGFDAEPSHLFGLRQGFVSRADWEDEEGNYELEEKWIRCQDMAEFHNKLKPSFSIHEQACHSTVLTPGDLLVVPPNWWCQSYALEPYSISSHRCSFPHDLRHLVDHAIKENCGNEPPPLILQSPSTWNEGNIRFVVQAVTELTGIRNRRARNT